MLVTLSGITTLLNKPQQLNAPSQIIFVPFLTKEVDHEEQLPV